MNGNLIYPYALNIRRILCFEQISDYCKVISVERQARIALYRFDRDKVRSLTAELLLRYALEEQFGMDCHTITFRYTKNGKPLLANSNVYFNLSHSSDWVVCAVGKNEIGIDVEELRQTDYKDIYGAFAETEIRLLNNLESNARGTTFYKLWTLKESYIKYCGTGLLYPFSNFSVDVQPDGEAKLIQTANGVADVRFYSRKLDEAHWYALCIPSEAQAAEIRFVAKQILFGCAI